MKNKFNYKKLTLTETIERLKGMTYTQQPYLYNNEAIFSAIDYLTREITDATPISDNATNGDVIKALFPNYEETRMCGDVRYGSKEYYNLEFVVDEEWWNAPYKKEVEE